MLLLFFLFTPKKKERRSGEKKKGSRRRLRRRRGERETEMKMRAEQEEGVDHSGSLAVPPEECPPFSTQHMIIYSTGKKTHTVIAKPTVKLNNANHLKAQFQFLFISSMPRGTEAWTVNDH